MNFYKTIHTKFQLSNKLVDGAWNAQLKKFVSHVDALTIHSYRLGADVAMKYGLDKAPMVYVEAN
jgi:hypothetical protein